MKGKPTTKSKKSQNIAATIKRASQEVSSWPKAKRESLNLIYKARLAALTE